MFSFFVLYTISSDSPQLIDLDNPLSFIPIGFAIILIPLSSYMFNSTLKQNLLEKTELQQKLAAFQTAHIIKMALLEGGALFAVVASLSTNTYVNLIVFAVLLSIMLISTPSVFKLTETLNLTSQEASSFEG